MSSPDDQGLTDLIRGRYGEPGPLLASLSQFESPVVSLEHGVPEAIQRHTLRREEILFMENCQYQKLVTWAVTIAMVGCSGSLPKSDGLPDDVLVPTDCSALPTAPEDMVLAIEQSDAPLMDVDLSSGEAQVAFEWANSDGERWLLPPPRDDSDVLSNPYAPDDRLAWTVGVKVPCAPEAAAFITFMTEEGVLEPLTSGDYPVLWGSFDVPEREQSSDLDSLEVEGFVTVTEASDGLVSGYLHGWGSGTLKSNLTQEQLGVRFTVGALAFRDVPLW